MDKGKLSLVVSSATIVALIVLYQLNPNALSNQSVNILPSKPEELIEQNHNSKSLPPESVELSTANSTLNFNGERVQGDSADYEDIIVCNPEPWNDSEAYSAMVTDYLNSLSDAVLYEQKLAYALFGNYQIKEFEDKRLPQLLAFDKAFPQEPLVLMDALNLCAMNDHPECTEELVDYALEADYENGAMWLNAAMVHAYKKNDDAVFEMISGIEEANFFNERHGERIFSFVDALSASPADSFSTNLMFGIGIVSATAIGYHPITEWCAQGASDAQKASACLTLGQNMETRAKLSINRIIGIALQSIVHQAEKNNEALKKSNTRSQALTDSIDYRHSNKAFDLFANDQKVMRQWLKNIDSAGEYAAFSIIIEEALEVSQFVGEDYCNR